MGTKRTPEENARLAEYRRQMKEEARALRLGLPYARSLGVPRGEETALPVVGADLQIAPVQNAEVKPVTGGNSGPPDKRAERTERARALVLRNAQQLAPAQYSGPTDKRSLQAEIRRLTEVIQNAKQLIEVTTRQLRAAEKKHRDEFGRAYHARIDTPTGELIGFTDEGPEGFDAQEWWSQHHQRALSCMRKAMGIPRHELLARLQIRDYSQVQKLPPPPAPKPPAKPRGRPRRELDREALITALRANGGSVRKTAESTGWPRNTVSRFIARENIGPGLWAYGQLKPEHGLLLERSAVSPQVAKSRGYSSVRDGLRIPVWTIEGESPWGQVRLDSPKRKDRRYRNDDNATPVIDVPPACRDLARDARRLLYVCESPRGADAGASAGLACVAMMGARFIVTDAPAWEPFRLRGRRVCIVFDADAATNPDVAQHEKRLAAFLASHGALVTVARLPTSAGPKTGFDDFLALGGSVAELLK